MKKYILVLVYLAILIVVEIKITPVMAAANTTDSTNINLGPQLPLNFNCRASLGETVNSNPSNMNIWALNYSGWNAQGANCPPGTVLVGLWNDYISLYGGLDYLSTITAYCAPIVVSCTFS